MNKISSTLFRISIQNVLVYGVRIFAPLSIFPPLWHDHGQGNSESV